MNEHPGSQTGLVASLRALLSQVLSLLATRGELAAVELAESRDRVLRWFLLYIVAAVLLLAALVTFSLWIAALFWDGPRGLALGLLTLAYAIVAIVAVNIVRREAASAPALLAQTRAELKKDRELLRRNSSESTDDLG